MVKPISPDECEKIKKTVPDELVEAVNELLVEHFRNGFATFREETIFSIAAKKGLEKATTFMFNDMINLYEEAGWIVDCDSPGYNESYPTTYTF